MINISNIKKIYSKGRSNAFEALRGISLTITDGESIAIIGQSGAGKSTLLNILRLQLSQSEGEIYYGNCETKTMSYDKLNKFKRDNIANIYQDYYLIEELSVYDNIELPLSIRNIKKKERLSICHNAIDRVGLTNMRKKRVCNLSGGEKQRVAIARAIASGAKYLMADEPTGALDIKNSRNIMDILFELNAEGITLIYVTHELSLAKKAKRIIVLRDGIIVGDVLDGQIDLNFFDTESEHEQL